MNSAVQLTVSIGNTKPPIVFECGQLLRLVRGKRAVIAVSTSAEQVPSQLLLKIFSGERHLRRELAGLKHLNNHKIHCPQVIFSGQSNTHTGMNAYGFGATQNLYVLLLEYFPDADSLRSVWHSNLADEERLLLVKRLLRVVARHHCAGITQDDLHLGNFLWTDEQLISIDGDAITKHHTLSPEACYQQLGTLSAQFFPRFDVLVEAQLPEYFETRKLTYDSNALSRIQQQRQHSREVIKRNKAEKCLRNGSNFTVFKGFFRHLYINQEVLTDELLNILQNLNTRQSETFLSVGGMKLQMTPYQHNTLFARNAAWARWREAQIKLVNGESINIPAALILNTFGPIHRSGLYIEVVTPEKS